MTSPAPPPSFSFYELLQACTRTGCPVCRIGAHSVKRYLESLFYEYVNDPASRDSILKSLGFCKEHVRLLLETRIADGFGASGDLGPCLACERRDAAADRAMFELNKSLHDEKLRLALQESDGLCFPHLAQLLERIQNVNNVRFLFELTENKLKARQSEMAELIRKNDYRFRSEGITEQEALAWRKAMCMMSGASISLTGDKHE